MKTLIIAIFTLALAIAPVRADPIHDLSDVSKETLTQGLQASGVCMVIEGYGINRLVQFYQDNKEEQSVTANRAALTAGMLYGAFESEKVLAKATMKVFKTKYHMTADDIGKMVNEETDAAQADMKSKYDDVDDYDDFIVAYEKSLTTCSDAITAFTDKVKKEIDILDGKDKTN